MASTMNSGGSIDLVSLSNYLIATIIQFLDPLENGSGLRLQSEILGRGVLGEQDSACHA